MRFTRFIALTIILILIDQITKAVLGSRDFFFGFLSVHEVKNFGLSFGLNFGTNINALILIFAVIIFLGFLRGLKPNIALSLLIAGAIANIIDRIALGYVRDFLDIGLDFTFNLADAYILLGLVLLILSPSGNRNDTKLPEAGDKI